MSISIKCTHCGKALRVPDDRLGKLAKCPVCGDTFTVLPANSVVGGGPVVPQKQKFAEHSGLSISPGLLITCGIVIAIIGVVSLIVFGPVRVWHEWEALQPHAEATVDDVCTRGLQSYESHLPWFDPKKDKVMARVRQVAFDFMPFSWKMPDQIPFAGVSNEGQFTGIYYPTTGEVSIDAEVGAVTFEGLAQDVHKGNGKIKITGREKNGNLTAEVDGKDATVLTPNSP